MDPSDYTADAMIVGAVVAVGWVLFGPLVGLFGGVAYLAGRALGYVVAQAIFAHDHGGGGG